MSIKLQTADGTITIGGQFQDALAAVKALPSRRYDPATKTWSTPLTAQEAAARISSLPVELPGGNHRTAYGNTWERGEWHAFQAANRADEAAGRQFDAPREALEQAARAEFAALGLSNQASAIVMAHIYDPDHLAGLRYSRPEKRDLVLAVAARYTDALGQLAEQEAAARDTARMRIYEQEQY